MVSASLPLLRLSDSLCSRLLVFSIFPFTSNSLAGTGFSLLLFYQATLVPGHSFLPRNDAADELARRGALLVSSAIPCSLFPLISRMHSCLFSDWRRTVSSKFFDTQAPSISPEELVLPRHARCVLSRNEHSLLLSSYLSRIGRIENPSCGACGHSSQDTSHLILHRKAADSLRRSLFDNSLCLSSGPDHGEFPVFWGSMVFRHALIPRMGSGSNNNNNIYAILAIEKLHALSYDEFTIRSEH